MYIVFNIYMFTTIIVSHIKEEWMKPVSSGKELDSKMLSRLICPTASNDYEVSGEYKLIYNVKQF